MPEDPDQVMVGDRVKLRRRGKKKIWTAEFFHAGQHRRVSMKTANLAVAKTRALKLAADLGEGKYRTAPRAVSYLDGVVAYLESLTATSRATSTIDSYQTVLTKFGVILAAAKVNAVGQMTPQHFDQFLVSRSKQVSAQTLCGNATVIKQFGRWLHRRRMIADNPFAEITLYRPTRLPKERPSLDQINQMLRVANIRLRSLVMVLAFTGARVGEVRRLRPEDIDLEGNWIMVRSRQGAETKTKTERKVPIHERLRPVLEAVVATAREPYLFTAEPFHGHPDSRPINGASLNRQFQRLAKKLGMPTGRADGFTLHSMRRFFESHTINAGIPQRVVDNWLGHSFDKSMGAVYYRLRDEESQCFMGKVPFGVDGPPATDAGKEVLS